MANSPSPERIAVALSPKTKKPKKKEKTRRKGRTPLGATTRMPTLPAWVRNRRGPTPRRPQHRPKMNKEKVEAAARQALGAAPQPVGSGPPAEGKRRRGSR